MITYTSLFLIGLIFTLLFACGVGLQQSFDPDIAKCYLQNKETYNIYDCKSLVSDPDFMMQWYLVPRPEPTFWSQSTVDLGILDVWINYGYFGQGVVLVDYNDGVETTHPDLSWNYDPSYSWDYCSKSEGPMPNPQDSTDIQGTMGIGFISMEMNNGLCGVGIAPKASFSEVRSNSHTCHYYNIKSDPYRYSLHAHALLNNVEQIDIAVHNYVPSRVGSESTYPPYSQIFEDALKKSILRGRRGKGIINIFSAGKNKQIGFTCTFQTYANNPYSIMVASSTPWGGVTEFSPNCPGIMVAAPSTTIEPNFLYTTKNNKNCDSYPSTAIGSLHIVAGIIALTLNAEPDLTSRDVQHLIAKTSSRKRTDISSYVENGAGYFVSHDFGFGIINAENMVMQALQFTPVSSLSTCVHVVNIEKTNFTYPENLIQSTNVYCPEVDYIEHVQVTIRMYYSELHDLQVDLLSPNNTRTKLLDRELGNKYDGVVTFTVNSVITWGESPTGRWTFQLYDHLGRRDREGASHGCLHSMSFKFFGTKQQQQHRGNYGRKQQQYGGNYY